MRHRIGVGALLVLAGMTLEAAPAAACGGCFGPTGQPSVVTAHRMAISLSMERTILWDQFEYSGNPEDFVWVLPVRGGADVTVEMADNTFFLALQQATAIQLQGPFRSRGGGGGFGFGCGASSAAFDRGPESDPVVVYHEGTVGPYETATIGSEDPNALLTWLQDRGYAVPNEMLPILEHYVRLEMSFVALRLAPGETVRRMEPVRVTTPGLNVSFPLRMVAAGVAEKVGIELYVIAEGRYEAANFPNGEIDRSAITYDWATQTYDYDERALEVLARAGSRTWLTEFAAPVDSWQIEQFSVTDDDGVRHDGIEDWRVATAGIPSPTVTRMRSDLPIEALGEDLVLQASSGQPLYGTIFVQREANPEAAGLTAPLAERESAKAALPPAPILLLGLAGLGLALRRAR
jgi:hypothetical protein